LPPPLGTDPPADCVAAIPGPPAAPVAAFSAGAAPEPAAACEACEACEACLAFKKATSCAETGSSTSSSSSSSSSSLSASSLPSSEASFGPSTAFRVAADYPPPEIVALPIGDEATLSVGDEVVLLGYGQAGRGGPPSATSTRGCFAGACEHPLTGGWLRTDALMLSGHSGGPLVNRRGEVVGWSVRSGFDRVLNGDGFYAAGLNEVRPATALLPILSEVLGGRRPEDTIEAGSFMLGASEAREAVMAALAQAFASLGHVGGIDSAGTGGGPGDGSNPDSRPATVEQSTPERRRVGPRRLAEQPPRPTRDLLSLLRRGLSGGEERGGERSGERNGHPFSPALTHGSPRSESGTSDVSDTAGVDLAENGEAGSQERSRLRSAAGAPALPGIVYRV